MDVLLGVRQGVENGKNVVFWRVPWKVNYYLVDPSWRSDIPLTTEG